jgi:soluble lytic murein transglycosylase
MNKKYERRLISARTVICVILLCIVVFLISSNRFWRFMYPIRYQTCIQQTAKFTQVHPLLVASVIRVESKFDTHNVSHAGAIGLMQLMPQTAGWIANQIPPNTPSLHLAQSADVSNSMPLAVARERLANPGYNILLGSWYIHYLTNLFQGNEVAAIAAYNGGPKRVRQWLTSGVWPGTLATISDIPVGETRHFVDRVFYNYSLYQRIYGNDSAWQRSNT